MTRSEAPPTSSSRPTPAPRPPAKLLGLLTISGTELEAGRLARLFTEPTSGPRGRPPLRLGGFAATRGWCSPDGGLAVTADAGLYATASLGAELRRDLAELARHPLDGGRRLPASLLLAAGWRRWGPRLPEHLDGDFAFVVWDARRRRLFAARDSAGARPLAFIHGDGWLAFASRPGDLLPLVDERRLDRRSAADLLRLDLHPSSRTLIRGLRRLPPGHRLELDAVSTGGATVSHLDRWWRPERAAASLPAPDAPPEEWQAAFRRRLERAVEGRLGRGAGAPAVLLSGGVDSSAVAVLVRHAGGGAPLLVSQVFPSFPACDESAFAAAVADHVGGGLHAVSGERPLLPTAPPGAGERAAFAGEPWHWFQERLAGPLHDRAAAAGVTVVLTGLGGDALFDAACLRYRYDARAGRWWRLPPWVAAHRQRHGSWPRALGGVVLKPLLAPLPGGLGSARGGGWARHRPPPWLPPEPRRRAGPRPPEELRGARRRQYGDLVGMAQQAVAVDGHQASALRRGLTAAHPLLDRRLAELVLAAPLALGAAPGPAGSKWLLRRSLADLLPPPVLRRDDKTGWGAYLAHLWRGEAGARATGLLRGGSLGATGLVDEGRLIAELECYRRGEMPSRNGVWFLPALLLEAWLRGGGP